MTAILSGRSYGSNETFVVYFCRKNEKKSGIIWELYQILVIRAKIDGDKIRNILIQKLNALTPASLNIEQPVV
jgi:hypothetical protein